MRKFTKSILALAMLCVASTASAQDVETDLTADMFKTWNGYGADAVATGDATVDFNIGNDATINAGGMVCGTGSVLYLTYADISGSSKIIIKGDAGLQLRVLMNRQESNNGPLVEKNPTIDESGSVEVDLTDLTYVHINAIKLGWGSSSGKISSIKFVKPADPYEVPKAALKSVIDKAKLYNSFAKTSASWNALQDAITDAETEYASPTSIEALADAALAIEKAIAALKLQDGYTNLTKDMYKNWDSATEPTTGTDASGACDYVLNASTSQPYGHGSVPLLTFADLSTFDTFYVLATGGTPRILLNRDVDEGQWNATEAESHLIDNTKGDGESWHAKYFSKDESNITVDLKQLAKDKNFAHLHTIKTVGGNVAVSDMLLYRTITVGAAGNATFGTLYKNAKPNGVKAYAAKVNGKKVELTEVENVPAGKGVVIEATEGSYAPTFDVDADDIDTDLLVSNGTIVGDGTIYVLAKKDTKVGFYKLENDAKVPAGKAYLKLDVSAPEFLPIAGNTTGIESVKSVEAKGEFFNLAGQRVAQPTKGLYIVNGKKVIK